MTVVWEVIPERLLMMMMMTPNQYRARFTTIVNQLLHADNTPGRPRPVGRHHYTWMDGAMQDLNALGPRLQMDLLRDWSKLALDRELWRGVASRC